MSESMGTHKRSLYCGELRPEHIGREMVLCGFVQRQRVLSNLIFIVLRDRTGISQLAFDDRTPKHLFEKAGSIRSEYVISAKGVVRQRESVNPDIPTGQVELYVSELKILSQAETPPFELRDDLNIKEELRLKHRYLDLRRPSVQQTLVTRHRIAKTARDYYDENGFVEIETPLLIKSTPEGARDYLVPSRVHPGEFYSLPQSPQLYKQLLMASGFDRYLQIAKCLRDEDLRADRQPEFTQIDTEMSFVDEEDVMAMAEGLIQRLYKEILGQDVSLPLRRIPYDEAMARFGSDKPDTRFGLELTDLSSVVARTEFKVFAGAVQNGGSVRAINAKGLSAALTRKEIDKLVDFVKVYGAKGLAYTRLTAEAESSSYEKFLSEEEKAGIRQAVGAEAGDVILIVGDGDNDIVYAALGALRLEIARRCGLIDESRHDILWITDFPLFEYDRDNDRFVARHHPFTHPKDSDIDLMESDPSACKAKAYDMVINGYEAGGGSIRINDPALQRRMFKAIGFTEEEAQAQFGFLLEAFRYGVPPHGGIAFGLDRLVMVLTGTDNIKDVIAFPKLQNASDPMSECPSPVAQRQLEELHIAIVTDDSLK